MGVGGWGVWKIEFSHEIVESETQIWTWVGSLRVKSGQHGRRWKNNTPIFPNSLELKLKVTKGIEISKLYQALEIKEVKRHTKPKASTRLRSTSSFPQTAMKEFNIDALCSTVSDFSSPRATISISGCSNQWWTYNVIHFIYIYIYTHTLHNSTWTDIDRWMTWN